MLIAGCHSAAPARAPAPVPPERGSPTARHASSRSDADVAFMQGMVGHHAQALAMTALLTTRTRRDDMRLLGLRIETSQRDEIAQIQRWLRNHHESVPDADPGHAHHGSAPAAMPGMLTEAEMAQLAATAGADFDSLFLQLMIRHHQGAITMVERLFGTNGAAQESEIYRFATDVDGDQRAEIARMRQLLDAMPAK